MHPRFSALTLVAVATLAACSTDVVTSPEKLATAPSMSVSAINADSYLVLFRGNGIPRDFAARVAAAGGTIQLIHAGAGIASVSGLTPAAATALRASADIADMQANAQVGLGHAVSPIQADAAATDNPSIDSQANPTSGIRFFFQWNMRLINAPTAWAAGKLGSAGVTAAIIDSGIDYNAFDLNGLVDLSRSKSFTDRCAADVDPKPDEAPNWEPNDCTYSVYKKDDNAIAAESFPTRNLITDFNGHGTNVASQVSSKALVLAGVTSRTTLIGVKVLGANGFGWTDHILFGVLWAADHGANVANMSIGGALSKAGNGRFVGTLNRVFNYALKKNMLIVVAAGNETEDLQHNANLYDTYCDAVHVLCVSAVGPGTATADPNTPAFFSNFGRQAVGVAAPGGNATFKDGAFVLSAWPWGTDIASWVWSLCSKTTLDGYDEKGVLKTPCSTGGRLTGEVGTSQASPHAAGLAALLFAEHPGASATAVKHMIEQSAVVPAGWDPAYGRGRIDVKAALGL